ncbi:MAG: ATP-binding protein [Nanoarchaeota archaeon]|nr:ATP-binding protein [DPANN group archaeon]MBL7116314.1 ATP-binding protein [Nanoarchaeota archaeon]
MYDIVIGRNEKDRKKFGTDGTILIGKHYVKMGRTSSLANKIFLDMIRSHVVFVCGKRGSGKSYTMGVIAEGVADLPKEIKQNISIIMLDTMGIYWTMKYPNKKDKDLLDDWVLEGKGLDVKIYTPTGYYSDYKKKGIPTDAPFSVKPSELDADDWNITFGINPHEPIGVLIERVIYELKDSGKEYDIDDVIKAINNDKDADNAVKDAAKNQFLNAKNWGVFDKKGTPLKELARGGQVTVLDVSCYATMPGSWNIKNLVIGLVSEKLFIERMISRKNEEYQEIHKSVNYFGDEQAAKQEFPLVWLVIDEAHEFLPLKGKTMATDPLVTILREGRQPGISLILATQQPGKIHTDVMTQSDTVISHRITARIDTEALGMLMQSYMREGLDVQLDNLPRLKGAAIIFDDTNEKMYPMRIRPRFTWHGGEAPSALHKKEDLFEE